MPALSAAKQQAYAAVCLGNQRGLIISYLAYASDNDDRLVCGNTFTPSDWNPPPENERPWALAPMDENGDFHTGVTDDAIIDEWRFRGIKKGVLYPYTKDVKLYHCPGDKRHKRGTGLGDGPGYRMWRSYEIQGGLNGEELSSSFSGFAIKRFSEIRSPGTTYVFVEGYYDGHTSEGAPGGSYNAGSWVIDGDYNGKSWWNIMAIWHVNSYTLSFADGHSSRMKCKDKRTIEYAEKRDPALRTQENPPNPDLQFMIKGYAVPLPRNQ